MRACRTASARLGKLSLSVGESAIWRGGLCTDGDTALRDGDPARVSPEPSGVVGLEDQLVAIRVMYDHVRTNTFLR